jgi:hypothetical protein
MTIKVEHDALLQVLQRRPVHPPLSEAIGRREDYILIDFCKPIGSDSFPVEKLRRVTSDDEDDSVYTTSTASLSDSDSDFERRVSFASQVVTDEWTRPFTPKDEVSSLYYSTAETQR